MIKLPKAVLDFMAVFQKNKYQIFVVGGAIRDLLLGKDTDNWDFTTNATPEQILKLFPDGYYNNQFGTVGIGQKVAGKDLIFEVTTFRKEANYKDNRHPQDIVWAKTIDEDLARRDFTINAIALKQDQDKSEIIDPYSGQKDLKKKVIMAVGNPDTRFQEDALRMLRAVRFAAELGFVIDEATKKSIEKNCPLITNISWERIRDEFLKILASDFPAEGIIFLKNTGILSLILPELDICFTIPQKSPKRHHIYDVGTHSVMALKNCPSKDAITRFATLVHDIGKVTTFRRDDKTKLITFYNHEVVGTKLTTKIADRLKLSNKQKEKLVVLVKYHQFTVSELQTDKAVRRFIRNIGKEYIQDMLDLRTGDRIGSGATPTSWRLELFKKRLIAVQKQPFTVADLKIDGHDVMEILKLKPGPKIGEILKKLFALVVDKKIKNEKETLLKYLQKEK